MNIKIGLIESPRELVINSELSHDEAVKLVKDVLGKADDAVSYTHLTLPTKRIV